MENLKDKITKYAVSRGADLVGIASVGRFGGAPDGHKPTNILSDAKTVIVCAKRLPNSVLVRGLATSYSHLMDVLCDRLDLIAYEMAIFIEQQGGVAIPVPPGEPYYDWDPDRSHGRGDLSHKHAAQAAGLGRLGKNSLLITPEFGNRVELVSIITNLDLEPDPLVDKELCPLKCMICIESCPVNAIAGEQRVNQKACRSHMFQQLPNGETIESCRECRRVCPAGLK